MPGKAVLKRGCVSCGSHTTCYCGVDGWIYFLVAERLGRVKIGYTRDMKTRLKDLQAASPVLLHVRVIWRGTYKLERALHNIFHKARVHNEWFELTPALEQFMSAYPSKHILKFSDLPKPE